MQISKAIPDGACESCFPVILVGRMREHQSCLSQHFILCSTQHLPQDEVVTKTIRSGILKGGALPRGEDSQQQTWSHPILSAPSVQEPCASCRMAEKALLLLLVGALAASGERPSTTQLLHQHDGVVNDSRQRKRMFIISVSVQPRDL